MIIDLEERPTESGTFDLKGGGKVSLRLLSAKDLKEMAAACFTTVPEYPLLKDPDTGKETYRRFEARKVNDDLWAEMQWDRNITGWEDLFDKHKKAIPVTKENKVLLMTSGKALEFVEAVTAGLKILHQRDKEKAEAAPKN